ncbi:polysaccharide lyase family 1 protein [Flavobacterium sp. GSA192]|uniref:pectate lyase family protein n=1 Tax=Flavobacterium sp. GSA192 TaxID=2576304 RepID=UPI00112D49C8|nr:T9SS C-terminal target domain-containing protein [Flavobacterium sp. GSA192]
MNLVKQLAFCAGTMITFTFSVGAQNQNTIPVTKSLKVDFDLAQRRTLEVNDPNYISWPISEGTQFEKSFGDLKVTMKGAINSSWHKTGMQAPFYARLVSDGIVADKSVEMEISGLSKGHHSLLVFSNTFDSPELANYAPVSIFVNGVFIQTIQPTNRVTATIQAATSYINFNAETGKDVVIRFEADAKATGKIQKVILNGFELDLPNLKKQANTPKPANNDGHVILGNDFKLGWNSPEGTVSHDFYFGENEQKVAEANHNSPEFKGNLNKNTATVDNASLSNLKNYYWRVDEIDANKEVTQGKVWFFKPAQIAFPGAEGYGRFAIGGRGGKVIAVTNLNDSGPGSLRDAVEQEVGPKTIVFNVSGNILLKSRLVVSQPFVTIAGQTAPGEGITISRAPIGLTGNDGIIRFLRVRIGGGTTYDGMGLTGANHSIIDHCSISWTIDESFSSRGAHNISLQRTLISEALNVAGHDKYPAGKMHGYAATIGGDVGSFHHNLLAHNYGRNWSIGGGLNGDGYYGGKIDIRNNVVYNWGGRATDGGANQVNFVNNYYKPGVATKIFVALNAQIEGVGKGKQQYYFDGNVMPGYFDVRNQEKGRKFTLSNKAIVDYDVFLPKPFFESHVNTQSAEAAYKNVLSDVGANQPVFDTHDQRIIQETLKGTYTYKGSKSGLGGMIDNEQDAGGWPNFVSETRPTDWDTDQDGLPNWWEEAKGLNVNSIKGDFADANEGTGKGFTQLEDYLNWMAQPHYFVNATESLKIDVESLFKGFTDKPKYTIVKEENGSASISKKEVVFKATKKGFASLEVRVEDADGDSMNRIINVFVK